MAWSPEDTQRLGTLWDNLAFFIGRANFQRKFRVTEGKSWWKMEDTFDGFGPFWGSEIETFTFFDRAIPGYWRNSYGSPPEWSSPSQPQMWGEPYRAGGLVTMTDGDQYSYWGLDASILRFIGSPGAYPNFDAYWDAFTYGMGALGWQFSKATLKPTRGGFWPTMGLEEMTTRVTLNAPGGDPAVWLSAGIIAGYTTTATYEWELLIRFNGSSKLTAYVTMYDTDDVLAPLRVHMFRWNVSPGPLTLDYGVTAGATLTGNNPFYEYQSTENVSLWMRIDGPSSKDVWDGNVPYIHTTWTNNGVTVSNPYVFSQTSSGTYMQLFERDTQLLYFRQEYSTAYTMDYNFGGWRWGTL